MSNKLLNTLAKNTFSNFIFSFVNITLELVQYAILIRLLPIEEYGILLFAGAILGQFNFLEIGLGVGLEKFIPEFRLKNQYKKISQAIVATTTLFVGMGIVVSGILLILVLTDSLGVLFKVDDIVKTQNIVLLVSVFAPISWGGKALIGSLKGFNQHHKINIINSSIRIFQFITVCLLAFSSYDIISLFLSLQLFEIIRVVWFQRTLSSFHKIELKNVTSIQKLILTIKQIFAYSMWVFLMELSSMLVNQFDKMIVSALIGIEQLVLYTGIVRMMKMLTIIVGRLNSAVIPIASELNVIADLKKFNVAILRGVRVTNAIAAPITALAIVFAKPILILLGRDYLLDYQGIYQIGVLAYMIISSRAFLNKMLIGAGDVIRFIALFSVLVSIFYLFSVNFLINLWNISGAILALPLTHLLFMPIWLFFVHKLAHINLKRFLLAVWQGQWPSLVVIFIFFITNNLFPFLYDSYISLFFIFCTYSTLLIVFSWHYTVDNEVKQIIQVVFSENLKKTFQKNK